MSKYLRRCAIMAGVAALGFALALPAGAQMRVTAGTIESVDAAAGTVTIKTVVGQTMTLTCDAASRVYSPGRLEIGPAAVKDLKSGDTARVWYIKKDGKSVCSSLMSQPPPHETLLGTITSVDAAKGSVTIKDAEGWTATFTCAADCKFATNGGQNSNAALSDLKVGDKVSAVCAIVNGKGVCHDLVGQRKVTP